ncbi:ABC transporter ATP-binding protein [Salinibacterium sp. ZJ70]|uniref:ABC transporter ATP-binding protein n=1 Tax=Salinibacterium sp. ZJ70 TaxID=2708084 RepID=UPI00141DA6BC|nr:ABC transporter ATP-binding protein [Salinibacterium sp. ZJ70]
MTSATVLDARNLTVDIDTARARIRVVAGVDLELQAGEALGLVGESGSGKSVFSRSAMGLHEDDDIVTVAGSSELLGEEVIGARVGRLRQRWGSDISIVLQDPLASLNPVRRIGTQLTETIRRHRPHLKRAEARAIALDLMRKVGIADPVRRLRVYPHELSGGMRQRVMIAMALSGNPSVLIADEPTTALDVTVQAQILDLLDRERRARQMGLILVTHDLSIVAARTDRVAVMYAGQIVEEAPTARIFAGPRMPYTRALLDAVPPLEGPTHVRLAAIPGSPPDPSVPVAGCRFADRCAFAEERCRAEQPELRPIDGDASHRVRCHFPLQPTAVAEPVGEAV